MKELIAHSNSGLLFCAISGALTRYLLSLCSVFKEPRLTTLLYISTRVMPCQATSSFNLRHRENPFISVLSTTYCVKNQLLRTKKIH